MLQLIHADYGTSDIYVTDYTSHPRLGIIAPGKSWSKGLEKCIARIRLSEQQRHIAESAVVGDFYIIRKLRLKYSPTEECFRGFLGGTERLIQALNRNNTDNEHLNGLLRYILTLFLNIPADFMVLGDGKLGNKKWISRSKLPMYRQLDRH